jgi:glutathione S-transferase
VPADTNDANDSLRTENPLGKIPILILENGATLYDSRVIEQYLDELAGGGKLLPARGAARYETLSRQVLADGVVDAAILLVYENRFRDPALHSDRWKTYQGEKIGRALARWEAAPPPQGVVDVVTISLACALGYLDLRFEGRWRADHPKLIAWLDAFAASVPAFEETWFKG